MEACQKNRQKPFYDGNNSKKIHLLKDLSSLDKDTIESINIEISIWYNQEHKVSLAGLHPSDIAALTMPCQLLGNGSSLRNMPAGLELHWNGDIPRDITDNFDRVKQKHSVNAQCGLTLIPPDKELARTFLFRLPNLDMHEDLEEVSGWMAMYVQGKREEYRTIDPSLELENKALSGFDRCPVLRTFTDGDQVLDSWPVRHEISIVGDQIGNASISSVKKSPQSETSCPDAFSLVHGGLKTATIESNCEELRHSQGCEWDVVVKFP